MSLAFFKKDFSNSTRPFLYSFKNIYKYLVHIL